MILHVTLGKSLSSLSSLIMVYSIFKNWSHICLESNILASNWLLCDLCGLKLNILWLDADQKKQGSGVLLMKKDTGVYSKSFPGEGNKSWIDFTRW